MLLVESVSASMRLSRLDLASLSGEMPRPGAGKGCGLLSESTAAAGKNNTPATARPDIFKKLRRVIETPGFLARSFSMFFPLGCVYSRSCTIIAPFIQSRSSGYASSASRASSLFGRRFWGTLSSSKASLPKEKAASAKSPLPEEP